MNRHTLARRAAACLIAALLAAFSLSAQSSTGSVRGTVQDPSGAVIPNVGVVLTNTATGVQLRTQSNESGLYVFPSVVPGPYQLSAESAGMTKFDASVTVQTAASTTIDIALKPAGTQPS